MQNQQISYRSAIKQTFELLPTIMYNPNHPDRNPDMIPVHDERYKNYVVAMATQFTQPTTMPGIKFIAAQTEALSKAAPNNWQLAQATKLIHQNLNDLSPQQVIELSLNAANSALANARPPVKVAAPTPLDNLIHGITGFITNSSTLFNMLPKGQWRQAVMDTYNAYEAAKEQCAYHYTAAHDTTNMALIKTNPKLRAYNN